jgi:hypothetical protein
MTEEYLGSDDPPEVSVENSTGNVMNLKVAEKLYTLQPGSTLSISLPAGTYSYYATEAGVIPSMGRDEWKVGYRYTWKFYLRSAP